MKGFLTNRRIATLINVLVGVGTGSFVVGLFASAGIIAVITGISCFFWALYLSK